MHIKEVNISGFRSYREVTSIDCFSPKHNVIVGRNGSGKSNFFLAIQFVLSDEFSNLRSEQRLGVLHESSGPRISTARVEIVFDNTDRRIPAIERTEVRVVRQVGQKKDQYYIDGKMVLRTEVINLMESAGFSRSNPYYIVKQGKINELAIASDSHRLKLLREVAGTRVYDERKDESLKILKETHNKTKKIETLLSYIDERLKTLEEEKEDLKEYQKWDKMKRSIEYTIYDTEANETRKKLERLLDQREELNTRQTKEALIAEQAERFEKKAELSLLINDLKEDVEKLVVILNVKFYFQTERLAVVNFREKSGRNKAEDVLNQVKADIREKEEELEIITPKYQKLVEQESALSSDIRIAETKSKELFAKQGHKDQFKSAEERDAYLRREVRHFTRQIGDTEEQMKDIEKSLEDEELGVELQENHIRMDKASSEHGRLKQEFDRAMVAQLDATREEKEVREQLNTINGEISQMEQQMRCLAAKSITNGVDGVRRVVQWFRDNNLDGRHDDVVKGYHGYFISHCIDERLDCWKSAAISRLAPPRKEYQDAVCLLYLFMVSQEEQQKDLEAQLADFSKQADIIFTKQSTLQAKREENVKKIRELGSLPTDAFSKYQGMSTKQLEKKLAECMHELKKYENVNKKLCRVKALRRSTEESEGEGDLIQVLDTRKYDAIQLTFKQVSKNFAEVFKKLVPNGSGSLVIQTNKDVSFDGNSETREMVQLSGGQKSLVALALIFAIQKCDPAPFYLFDEIDAALDGQHRVAVADMIHELAENAQFITTTFRPELLESAEKYYGVKFRNKVSHIDVVTKEQAYDFVEDDTTHG
ncbi:unnamed protein product [Angiostrongylus costaricensis]|uniref:Structural maintenance of chromosomes protein 3 n=1 Tax=Angiostrongylus costaricensis TaxID=334426 RepID=A0A158PJ22_ANGCS|nr:unnamed protein product [Angiostrongylus costaricensis]